MSPVFVLVLMMLFVIKLLVGGQVGASEEVGPEFGAAYAMEQELNGIESEEGEAVAATAVGCFSGGVIDISIKPLLFFLFF